MALMIYTYGMKSGIHLDEIDRKIVVATQSGLPLVRRPFLNIAMQLGVEEQEVIHRMRVLQEHGIIRRIAAVPNHYALGFRANGMSVWDVPDEMINVLGKQIGSLAFVSHCYHRPRHLPDWPYNLFAMVHAHDHKHAMSLVDKIAALLGENDRGHDVLFSQRILKKTGMRISPSGEKNVSN
jgi:DNA-binding Lrp family transcriptional regulator